MIISFSGPDGSGKTTLANKLVQKFKADGEKVLLETIDKYFIIEPLFKFVRKTDSEGVNKRLDYSKKNILVNMLTMLTLFDVWVHYMYLRLLSLNKYTIITDRYFYDRAAGFYLHGYLNKFFSNLYLKLVPKSDIRFLIKVPPKLAIKRETEDTHDFEFHTKISGAYSTLFSDFGMVGLNSERNLNYLIKNMFDQYRTDLFKKLNFNFESGKTLLDVGCGDGKDAEVFINKYNLKVQGVDVYTDPNALSVDGLRFVEDKEGVLNLPFDNSSFDYVYMHDVLHHVDEENQSYDLHEKGLEEVKRVVKLGGKIIIIEGNRFNPLFYPHMVSMLGHNHFTQKYFKKLINTVFDKVEFKFFECHYYPKRFLRFFYFYEKIMEKFSPKKFLAYNIAIIEK